MYGLQVTSLIDEVMLTGRYEAFMHALYITSIALLVLVTNGSTDNVLVHMGEL